MSVGLFSIAHPMNLADARKRAESRVAGLLSGPPEAMDAAAAERLLHELGVHQAELELQNEQLRQTQGALADSRDRYIALFDDAPVGYVTLGLNGTIIEANHQAGVLLALQRSQVTTHRLTEFIAIDDRPRYLDHFAKMLSGAGTQVFDVRMTPTMGEPRWMAVQMSLTTDAETGTRRCRAALVDIDARVQMQEEVSRLAAIVASSEDSIISLDMAGRVTSWNDAARRLFGYEPDEVMGQTLQVLVPPDRRDEAAGLLRRLRDGQTIAHLETERLARGGVSLPLSLSVFPLRNDRGSIVGSALIARDISQRRRAEVALRERLHHLDILCQAGQMLIMGDADLDVVRHELFQRLARAVGCEVCLDYSVLPQDADLRLDSACGVDEDTARQWLGTRMPLAALGPLDVLLGAMTSDDSRRRTSASLGLLAELGVGCFASFPLRVQRRIVGLIVFASSSREWFGEANVRVIQTVCDQVSVMLERRQLVDELHLREQALRSADRAKDAFIATLAHELRNPLAPIRNALQVLHRDDASNPHRLEWCRDIIERQVSQMTHLLEDLLDVSRLTRNRIDLRRDRFDLMLAMERALESARPLIESSRHAVELDVPDTPIWVEGDLTRLTQIFTNLLNNAAKYTDKGGRIRVQVRVQDDWTCVSVRDNGAGINPADLPRVFDMFTQLEPSPSDAGGGLGIGLALSRGLVELHGGTIEAHSKGRGQGSEFTVRLPALRAAAPPAAAAGSSPAATSTERRRVLVVDDNVDAAATLATFLELEGHDVRTASRGDEALRLVEHWQPDVMLLDIGMPDMDGYELCQRIRARGDDPPPLMVACTGWGQPEDRLKSKTAGFDIHLVKPVEPDAVLELLEHANSVAH